MKRKQYNNQNTSFPLLNWMVGLGLKNYELVIYALIYSFTHKEGGVYRGSISYLCNRIHVSKSTVIRVLNSLVEKKLLIKTWCIKNGVKYVTYKHSQEMLEKAGLLCDSSNFEGSFFTIYDWMISKMNLSGHALTVYALLYSFSQGPNKRFEGNLTYISKRLNMSTKQVKRIIDKLMKDGYLVELSKYNARSQCAIYRTRDCEELEDYYRCSDEPENNTEDSCPQSVYDANFDELEALSVHKETVADTKQNNPSVMQDTVATTTSKQTFAIELFEDAKEGTNIPAVLQSIFAKISNILTLPEQKVLEFLCSKVAFS